MWKEGIVMAVVCLLQGLPFFTIITGEVSMCMCMVWTCMGTCARHTSGGQKITLESQFSAPLRGLQGLKSGCRACKLCHHFCMARTFSDWATLLAHFLKYLLAFCMYAHMASIHLYLRWQLCEVSSFPPFLPVFQGFGSKFQICSANTFYSLSHLNSPLHSSKKETKMYMPLL